MSVSPETCWGKVQAVTKRPWEGWVAGVRASTGKARLPGVHVSVFIGMGTWLWPSCVPARCPRLVPLPLLCLSRNSSLGTWVVSVLQGNTRGTCSAVSFLLDHSALQLKNNKQTAKPQRMWIHLMGTWKYIYFFLISPDRKEKKTTNLSTLPYEPSSHQ